MSIFRRKLTPEEFGASVDRFRDMRVARTVAREAERVVLREYRATALAAEVARLRAEMGLEPPAPPAVPEIATPEPAPVKVPKVRKPRKVSPAPVEAIVPPAPVSADVAQAAPVAASPAIAAETTVSPERPRKRRTVAAKLAPATVPEVATVAEIVTVKEPCGVVTHYGDQSDAEKARNEATLRAYHNRQKGAA